MANVHAVLHHADQQPADHVNHHNENAGDGVAAHELTGAVHRTVEVRFLRHFATARFRLLFADQASVQVGVDRHLFARHAVKHEARAHFRDTPCAFGDNHEVDHYQDNEHHDADGEVAADEEVAERLDHPSRRARAGVTFHQNDARRGDVQRQAQQRREEQNGREGGELQRALGEHRHQQHHNRERDIKGEQQIEDEGGQRQHHHRQDHHDQHGTGKHLPLCIFQIVR